MEDVTTKSLGLVFGADELTIILDGLEQLRFTTAEQLAGAKGDEMPPLRRQVEFIEETIIKISDAIQYAPIPDDLVQTVAPEISPEVAALTFADPGDASSACRRQRWCIRQVGHAGDCAAIFGADGSVVAP